MPCINDGWLRLGSTQPVVVAASDGVGGRQCCGLGQGAAAAQLDGAAFAGPSW
jgi:hypothetical protein